ncbi:MAG: glycosyltransferase family 4 protein [Thermodesulfobacteriota bacterium]|nr:glycosyltransferase family 4 protein [Thermodesulfobacteriota bacterium]
MKVLLLTRYNRLGASSRLRSFQYIPWFKKAGFECTVSYLVDSHELTNRYREGQYGWDVFIRAYWRRLCALSKLYKFDLVWIEKEALPWMPAWFERWLLSGVPYVLDYDDAIFHKYDQHPNAWVRRIFRDRIDNLMAKARLVVAGNTYLADRARDAGAVWVEVVPTAVDLDRYTIKSNRNAQADILQISWIGTPCTSGYLNLLRRPLEAVGGRYRIKLCVIGGTMPRLSGVEIEVVPWAEATEVSLIRASDIGVMPLKNGPVEWGKCGYKLIQYMACGLPVVASPIGANCDIVSDGENGFLANTEDEWQEALNKLLGDAVLRREMGWSGRKKVEDEYCLQKTAPILEKLLRVAAKER